ncbi:MAG: penicillin-binding protein activator [Rickettsia endosymbiont of Bryobia graminum]|nr:penicillin-binding protein activator [Rickettsia endosymbiont of Bryobia graminum]
MNIIKQKFLNTIVSFICCMILLGCQSNKEVETPIEERETIEIAILMPLTGDNAVIGQQYNKLIKIGIEDSLQSYAHVTSYDGSDEKQVTAAIDKIIDRETKIILGPLSANLTAIVVSKVRQHDILVITMSNNPVLADTDLFVFGHAPLKQLTKIINYFCNKEYSYFFALLPDTQHSKNINQIIQDTLTQKNAYLVRSEFYSNLPESINDAVSNILNNVENLNEQEDISKKAVIYISGDSGNINLLFDSINKYNLDKKAVMVSSRIN